MRALGFAIWVCFAAACSSSSDAPATSSDAGGGAPSSSSSSGGAGGGASCAAGETTGPGGACVAAGIRGCAKMFVDEDGICRPSIDKCPAGRVPKFDEGCVAAGISDCAAPFSGSVDGICHPTQKKCDAGTFAVPQKGCVSIDGPGCGAGTWGLVPDEASTIYVDAAAIAGGDGSKGSPLTTLADALAVVTPGATIALAAGDYAEPVAITSDVTIAGRCASMVRISGDDGSHAIAKIVHVTGAKATLRGLSIGGHGVGVYAEAQADVTLDGIAIDGAFQAGVVTTHGTKLAMKSSVVENTTADNFSDWSQNGSGFGVSARSKSVVTITDSAILANGTAGIHGVDTGTKITAKDVLVEGTTSPYYEGDGIAAVAFDQGYDTAATFDLEAVALVDNTLFAIDLTQGPVGAPTLTMRGSLLEAHATDTALWMVGGVFEGHNIVSVGSPDFAQTTYYDIETHGKLTLDQSLIRDGGVFVGDGDFTVTDTALIDAKPPAFLFGPAQLGHQILGKIHADLSGVLVASTAETEYYGYGIYLGGNAALTLDASFIDRVSGAGVLADQKSKLTVTSSLVSGTKDGTFYTSGMEMGTAADGIDAAESAVVSLDGVRVERCGRAGMLFAGATGTVRGSVSTKNQYGLVLEEQTKIEVDTTNLISKNTDQDQVGDSELPVPTSPAHGP